MPSISPPILYLPLRSHSCVMCFTQRSSRQFLRFLPAAKRRDHMRRPITFAIAVGVMSLFGLIFWQGGVSTDAAGARLIPEYGVSSSPYLPIQRLEPVY